jgi:polysaccharide pyruvyl transferase WcaK-like protein
MRNSHPTSSRPRIALFGHFGTLNYGNECTLAATIANLRERLPSAELVVICSDQEDAGSRHHISALPMRLDRFDVDQSSVPRPIRWLRHGFTQLRAWLYAWRACRKLSALIIVGAGILNDYGSGTLGFPYELMKWTSIAKRRGAKVLFWSVGTESTIGNLGRRFITMALRNADYRSYRDEQSRKRLLDIGFDDAVSDHVFPDLVFSLPVQARASADTHGRTVAVGVYNYRDQGVGNADDAAAYRAYVEWICDFIVWLLGEGYAVRTIIGDGTFDTGVMLDVRKRLTDTGAIDTRSAYDDAPAQSVEEIINQLAGVDLVVATRFHNVLLGLLLGRPAISISYDAKNDALMEMMGLAKYCQTIDDYDFAKLKEQFRDLEANAAGLRPGIEKMALQFRQQLDDQYEHLLKILGQQSGD